MMTQEENPSLGSTPGVLSRPLGQLEELPLELRWEVTRRHPYYLTFWKSARRHMSGDFGDTDAEKLILKLAATMVHQVGVDRDPPDPATDFASLAEGSDPTWLKGTVRPLTFRGMVGYLLKALPPADRAVIGAILMSSGQKEYHTDDENVRASARLHALGELTRLNSTILDSYPDAPLCYINTHASQRTIVEDIGNAVRHWKQRQEVAPHRLRPDTIRKQLEVRDLREGWSGAGYDRSRERRFKEIATQQKCRMPTVAELYYAAFRWVIGYDFTPELWARSLGLLKLSEVFEVNAADIFAMPRRLLSNSRRAVPETVGFGDGGFEGSSPIQRMAPDSTNAVELQDLLSDLQEMIEQGLPNDQIASRLKISESAVTLLRDRFDESRSGTLD